MKLPIDRKKYTIMRAKFVFEGVGDKYAERVFHIPDETYMTNIDTPDNGIYIGRVLSPFNKKDIKESVRIFKNPKTLENFDRNVRAILVNNGDLYIQETMKFIKHEEIIDFLRQKHILNKDDKLPKEFIPLERDGRSNVLKLAWNLSLPFINSIFLVARKKHPNLKFDTSVSDPQFSDELSKYDEEWRKKRSSFDEVSPEDYKKIQQIELREKRKKERMFSTENFSKFIDKLIALNDKDKALDQLSNLFHNYPKMAEYTYKDDDQNIYKPYLDKFSMHYYNKILRYRA